MIEKIINPEYKKEIKKTAYMMLTDIIDKLKIVKKSRVKSEILQFIFGILNQKKYKGDFNCHRKSTNISVCSNPF